MAQKTASIVNISSANIMNVREIIESAFGDPNANAVNFKLVQTVLFLIARQMKLLERRVELELGSLHLMESDSTLSVTEVKVHAMQDTPPKKSPAGAKQGGKGKPAPAAKGKPAPKGKPGKKKGDEDANIGKADDDAKLGKADDDAKLGKADKDAKLGKPDKDANLGKADKDAKLGKADKDAKLGKADKDAKLRKADEDSKSPSEGSMQTRHEKLLVVQSIPTSEAKKGPRRMSQISLVTKEQYDQLRDIVLELEEKFKPAVGTKEHQELMQQLRKTASLTDGMAALQLSARLEATEKALEQMTSMVAQIVSQSPGVKLDVSKDEVLTVSDTQTLVVTDPSKIKKFGEDKDKDKKKKKEEEEAGKGKGKGGKAVKPTGVPSEAQQRQAVAPSEPQQHQAVARTEDTEVEPVKRDLITYPDLYEATRDMKAELKKTLEELTRTTMTNAEAAHKLSMKLDSKIDTGPAMTNRMAELENSVKQYADQINVLDAYISYQTTLYQEQLTQMQHELEVGLDTLNEVLGNTGSDTVAIAELHGRFNSLQTDFDNMANEQNNLNDLHNITSYDIAHLWKRIEQLRNSKSDREEVAEALSEKAGIGELNGLVSIDQFEAVRGDFGKRICEAFEKFNVQEKSWQKSIESAIKVINEKADLVQIQCLQDDINNYLNKFHDRMKIMTDIVGEPKNPMVSKKVFRDTACLSCSSPAHMDLEEPNKDRALTKSTQPGEGDETKSQTKGGGDSGICYPNAPIPHPRDPRSLICKRYCGSKLTEGTQSQPALTLKPLEPVTTAPQINQKIPCLPCNTPKME